MKKERFIILLGILVVLVFFYLGLNEWLKTKDQNAQPPPLIVKPVPQTSTEPVETKEEATQQKPEEKQPTKDKEQDVIAQKIKEEQKNQPPVSLEKMQKTEERQDAIAQGIKDERNAKKSVEKRSETKTSKEKVSLTEKPRNYTVQIGAFRNKDGAEKVAEKAKKMGYKVNIVEEDDFYKVRLSVNTENIESELRKLRTAFGSAILKR